MITAGLDLSLVASGVVILEDGKLVSKNLVTSKPKGQAPISEMIRLMEIVDTIESDIIKYSPDIVAVEGIAFMANGKIAQLAGLNYLVRRMLVAHGIKFYIVAPTSLKKFITGKGVCQKDTMMLEVYKRYGVSIPENNLCDAYSLARMAYATTGADKTTKIQNETLELLKKQYED